MGSNSYRRWLISSSSLLFLDGSSGGGGVQALQSRVQLAPPPRPKLHQLLGLEEALQVPHLPDAGDDEDEGLSDGPPENALVGALARHAKALLAVLKETKKPVKGIHD